MEYIIALILGLLGFGAYNYKKRKAAEVDAVQAETKGRDAELKVQQEDLEAAVADIDSGIQKLNEDRQARKEAAKDLSDQERADGWDDE